MWGKCLCEVRIIPYIVVLPIAIFSGGWGGGGGGGNNSDRSLLALISRAAAALTVLVIRSENAPPSLNIYACIHKLKISPF